MTRQNLKTDAAVNVPQTNRVIKATACQNISFCVCLSRKRAKAERSHATGMSLKHFKANTFINVPQANLSIVTTRCQHSTVGAERNCAHPVCMSRKYFQASSTLLIPQARES